MTNAELSIMNDIMSGVSQTREWNDRQETDPCIKEADDRFTTALDAAKQYIPLELYNELADANAHDCATYSDAGILYGIHVGMVIKDASAHPNQLAQFWLDRMEGKI